MYKRQESQGIDGYVDGEPVSIKPNTYKKTIQSGKESIPYRIIFYKNTKRGLVVSWRGVAQSVSVVSGIAYNTLDRVRRLVYTIII